MLLAALSLYEKIKIHIFEINTDFANELFTLVASGKLTRWKEHKQELHSIQYAGKKGTALENLSYI